MEGFNFVATTYRNKIKELVDELNRLLKGYVPIDYLQGIPLNSVVYGKLNGDPVKASRDLYNAAYNDPWTVRRVLKFYPIQLSCKLDELQMALERVTGNERLSDASVEVEIRLSKVKWGDLIKLVRPYIDGSMFKKAGRVLLIQIVMDSCGVSLLNRDEIFRALEAKLAGSYFP